MRKPGVLLCLTRKNWYSFVPLVNSLDRSGIDAEIVLSRNVIPDLRKVEKQNQPIVCCLSFYTTQVPSIWRLVSRIRSEFGDGVKLVGGGAHATGSPNQTLSMGFDVVVRGEGELVLPKVIERLVGDGDGFDGEWPIVKGRPLDTLDMFPPVSFRRHLYPPLEITRGCLFACRYCSVPDSFGPIRHRSVESVLRAAKGLLALGRPWDFRFISPNSLGYGSCAREPNEEAVENLLGSLGELKGKKRIFFATFPSEARPDFVTGRMVDIISELADNRTMSIGAQSGSERVLEAIGRGHDLGMVYHAAELILSGGLTPVVDFILGLPGEEESDQVETLHVMQDLTRMGCEVRVHHFIPLAGSSMAGRIPSTISPLVLAEIGRMALRGQATGSFTEQMRLAREICRWQDLSRSPGNPNH